MPDWNRYVRERLNLRIRPDRETEVVSELAQLLELKYAESIGAGMPEPEAIAKTEALTKDWTGLAAEIDDAERPHNPPELPSPDESLFGGLWLDFRYALRLMRKSPGFALITIATLALGTGANTAMFTIVDAVAIRPLPYPEPDRLVTLGAHRAQTDIAEFTSAPDFFDLRNQSKALSALAGISPVWNMVSGDDQADRLECLFVSSNFLPLLGARTALGRLFTPDEDDRARPAARIILGYSFWQRRFGGQSDALGRKLTLDGNVYRIVGVMQKGFRYLGEPIATAPTDVDAYLPMAANPLVNTARTLRYMKVLGKLAPGATLAQANDELQRIAANLAAQYPQSNRGFEWHMHALRDEAVGRYRSPVLLLLGAVGFVLLLCSANVANMLLARVAGRRQEISIRAALGASRSRILRQLLAESLVLAAAGGVCGAGIGSLLLRLVKAVGPESLLQQDFHLNATALFFTAGVAILASLFAGLTPAWYAGTAEIGDALRAAGRSVTARSRGIRSVLVAGEIALALVLLVGAGLLIRSFQRLLAVSPGFRTENLVTIATQFPASVRTPSQRRTLYQLVASRLAGVSGVEAVAAVSRLPMMTSDLTSLVVAEGRPPGPGQGIDVQFRRTSNNYFATMGIPLIGGRSYNDQDAADASIAVIDETTAQLLFPGENAVGKRVRIGPDSAPWTTVIGVVGATRQFGLEVLPKPTLYLSAAGSPFSSPIMVVRTARDPGPLIGPLMASVRGAAHGMPAYNVFQMQTLVDRSTAQRRFLMMLLTAFASTAMLLAALGIYGSISQTVSHRTRELGLRLALGASRREAFRLVLNEGFQLTSIGVAIGAGASLLLTRLMRGVLFGVGPFDPPAFVIAAAVLALVALAACTLPARRATQVDPLVALRDD
jgi:predicted permease